MLMNIVDHRNPHIQYCQHMNDQIDLQSQQTTKQDRNRKLLFAWEFLHWVLIVIYCILSQSIQSTTSLLFLLIDIKLTFNQYYVYRSKGQILMGHYQTEYVQPLRLKPALWITYIILNIGFLIFKMVYFIGGNLSVKDPKSFQVQQITIAFVPTLLIFTAIPIIFLKHQSVKLTQFYQPIKQFVIVPVYLVLTVLLVFLQMLNYSILGIFIIFALIALIVRGKWNFSEGRWVIQLISFMSGGILVGIFAATMKIVYTGWVSINFLGFEILTQRNINDPDSQGYLACLILVYLTTVVMDRFFIYQAIHSKSELDRQKFLMQPVDTLNTEQQEESEQQQDNHQQINMQYDLMQQPNKVPFAHLRQLQLTEREPLPPLERSQSQGNTNPVVSPQAYTRKLTQLSRFNRDFADRDQSADRKQSIHDQPMESPPKNAQPVKPKTEGTTINLEDITKQINKVIKQWYSINFIFRLLQLMSIVIIQRYNTVYSVVIIVWLIVTELYTKIKFLRISVIYALMPMALANYLTLYYFNIPDNYLVCDFNCPVYGFQKRDYLWLDVIILNIYLYWILMFIKRSRMQIIKHKRQMRKLALNKKKKSQITKKLPSYGEILLAIIYKYSYLVTLVAIYWVGFSGVNLLHLIFILIFLIFFSSGERLIAKQKIVKGQTFVTLSSFTYEYWWVIVVYTGLAILAKYLYFLYFTHFKYWDWLPVTGLAEVYDISFNFSFTAKCQSNTTPFFIIYIFAALQYSVSRSKIYMEYTFSLMSMISKKDFFKARWESIERFWNLINIFYYQSLFKVAAVLVLLLNFRWSVNGIVIGAISAFGMIFGFGNGRTWYWIMWVNLTYIFGNYFLLFITCDLTSIINNADLVDSIINWSEMVGAFPAIRQSSPTSIPQLHYLFLENMIIFLLSVMCTQLYQVLTSTELKLSNEGEQVFQDSNLSSLQGTIRPQSLELGGETNVQNIKSATNFKKKQILVIAKFFECIVVKEYPWFADFCKLVASFITDIGLLIVILCCLYFRLSISMLMFLGIYLYYYYTVFTQIGRLYKRCEYYLSLNEQLQMFVAKIKTIYDNTAAPIYSEQQNYAEFQSKIKKTRVEVNILKLIHKKKIWIFSAILSFVCFVLTYSTQCLGVFCQQYTPIACSSSTESLLLTVERGLFVLGVSCSFEFSYWRQNYFYFVMVIICMIERILISFIAQESNKQEIQISQIERKHKEPKINGLMLIEEEQQNQNQDQIKSSNLPQDQIQFNVVEPITRNRHKSAHFKLNDRDVTYEANLMIFFKINQCYMFLNLLFGLMSLLLRLYVLLLLFNSYEKSNIFSWIYLIVALVYWIKPIEFSMIEHINKISIFILLAQYTLLLFNINSTTSPYYPDNMGNLSLINFVLKDQTWINYLAFGKTPNPNLFDHSDPNGAFLINSVIVFATQYYFTLFHKLTLYTLDKLMRVKFKYDYIVQQLKSLRAGESLYVDYSMYKSKTYRFLRKAYELLIINSHLIVALIILEIVVDFNTILSIVLLLISAGYFFLAVFSKNRTDEKKIQKYTHIYFLLYKIITFSQLFVITIVNVPTIINICLQQQTSLTLVCNQIKLLSIPGEIFLLFIIQLWFDLEASHEYRRFSEVYYRTARFNQLLMSKAATYRNNNRKFKQLEKDYKQILDFEKQIQEAIKSIEQWHKITKKEYSLSTETKLKSDEQEHHQNKKLFYVELENDQQQMTTTIKKYLKEDANSYLHASYTNIILEIQLYNMRLMNQSKIDIKHYIIENFEEIQNQIIKLDAYYKNLYNQIVEIGNHQAIIVRELKKLPDIKEVKSEIDMPELLNIKPEKQQLSNFQILLYYFLSKFDSILTFFLIMYYAVNPCLASLPILLLLLSYEILSNNKIKNILSIYIILVVIMIQSVLQYSVTNNYYVPTWYMYMFFSYNNTNFNNIFSTQYLNFLFVLIFINQLISKYSGFQEKHPDQIENQYQALIRCFLNSGLASNPKLLQEADLSDKITVKIDTELQQKMNTTNLDQANKQSKEEEEYLQPDRNPYQVFEEMIHKNPLLLTRNQITTLAQTFSQYKTGIDLYPVIASSQILIVIYLIFFYPLMVKNNDTTLDANLKYWKFSSDMIIVILLHVTMMVIQRKITLMKYQRGTKETYKYVQLLINLVLILFFVYYYAPYNGTGITKLYHPRPALVVFMLIQCLYFTLSAYQVKLGYKKYKRINSFMHKRNDFNYYILSIFVAIPFLYELKMLMDWSFVRTSLQIYDWCKHSNIYLISFESKINALTAKSYKLGEPMSFIMKIIYGWVGSFLILTLLFGPMVLFSNLNPTSLPNLVVGGQLQIGISIVNGNYFPLYSTSHFSMPPQIVSQQLFDTEQFSNVPAIMAYSPSQLSQQFQNLTYFPSGDNLWQISTANYDLLISSLNQTIYQINNGSTPTNTFVMTMNYQLTRQQAATIATPTQFNYPLNGSNLNVQQLTQLNATLSYCSTPSKFQNFYISLISLYTIGTTYKPRYIPYSGDGVPSYYQNISLELVCTQNITNSTKDARIYWNANLDDGSGIQFFVLCDKYQALSFGFSFISLYTSVILVVATYVRSYFTGNLSLIPYNQNPKPQYILNICEAISIIRMRGDLKTEYLMYYELIDIIRSPEIIKYMCGSYTKMIKEEDEARNKKHE